MKINKKEISTRESPKNTINRLIMASSLCTDLLLMFQQLFLGTTNIRHKNTTRMCELEYMII